MEKPFTIFCVLHFTRHFMCLLMVGIPFCRAVVCIFSGVAFNINHNSLSSLHIVTSFQNRYVSTNHSKNIQRHYNISISFLDRIWNQTNDNEL